MRRPIILDTNLLLLLIVGAASLARSATLKYLGMHKRLKDVYTEEDYAILISAIDGAPHIIITPNTMTETSNLLRHIKEPARSEIAIVLRECIKVQREIYINSANASTRNEYIKLGLTDSALLEVAALPDDGMPPLLLTTDLDLFIAAECAGYLVVNFNHLRNM